MSFTRRVRGAALGAAVLVVALVGMAAGIASAPPRALAQGRAASAPATDVPSTPFLRLETGMHGAVVNRIVLDPAGRFFISVSDDKTVRLWSTADGKLLSTLRVPLGSGDEGALYAAALSPDGRTLLVGGATGSSWDRTFCLYLFDVTTQRLRGRLPGLPAVINHAAYSADGRRFAVALGGRAGVKVYDAANGRLQAEDAAYGDRVTWVAFARDGRLATASLDGQVRLYDAAGVRVQQQLAPGGRPYSVAFSPDGGTLAVGSFEQPRVDLLDGRTLQGRMSPRGAALRSGALSVVAWGPHNTLYAGGTARDTAGAVVLRRWAGGGAGASVDLAVARDTLAALAPLPDGGVIFGSADPRIGRLDAAGRVVFARDGAGFDFREVGQRTLALSADGLSVSVHPAGRAAPLRFDLATRTLTSSESGGVRTLVPVAALPPLPPTAPPPPSVAEWRNRRDPKIAGATVALEAEEIVRSVAGTPDGRRVVFGTDYYVRVHDGTSAAELHKVGVPAAAWGVAVSGTGQVVVAALGDGTLKWFGLDAGGRLTELANLFVNADGQRWVAWTQDGFFDHSDVGGKELVGYQVNRGKGQAPDWYSFAQVYRLFYAPDLVSQSAGGRGQTASAARLREIGDLRLRLTGGAPPRIDLVDLCYTAAGNRACLPLAEPGATRTLVPVAAPTPAPAPAAPPVASAPPAPSADASADVVVPDGVRAVELRFKLTDGGGGLGSVDVFLNDRNVGRSAGQDGQGNPSTRTVPIDAGQSRLQVRAYDQAQGTYNQSRSVVIVSRAPSRPPAARAEAEPASRVPVADAPRLFVVAAGVDRYKDPIPRLRYAVADAKTFAQTVRERGAQLYSKTTVIELYDAQATLAGVTQALERVGKEAESQDTVLIYLSGHGDVAEKRYYFATSDVTSSERLAQEGLGEAQLVRLLGGIRARNGFVFLDTCFAGAFSLDASSQLAHESGRYVLAAASSTEEALDSYNNKNGVFAYAVLRGLQGEAVRSGKQVNQIDLGFFVAPKVGELAKQKGHRQSARFKIAAENAEPFPLAAVE